MRLRSCGRSSIPAATRQLNVLDASPDPPGRLPGDWRKDSPARAAGRRAARPTTRTISEARARQVSSSKRSQADSSRSQRRIGPWPPCARYFGGSGCCSASASVRGARRWPGRGYRRAGMRHSLQAAGGGCGVVPSESSVRMTILSLCAGSGWLDDPKPLPRHPQGGGSQAFQNISAREASCYPLSCRILPRQSRRSVAARLPRSQRRPASARHRVNWPACSASADGVEKTSAQRESLGNTANPGGPRRLSRFRECSWNGVCRSSLPSHRFFRPAVRAYHPQRGF